MKRILIITAMSAMSLAAIAAEVSNRADEQVIVVIGHEFHSDHTALLPVLTMAMYTPEFSGEVIPDFVPAEVEDVLPGVTSEIFHPPKGNTAFVRHTYSIEKPGE